MQQTPQNRPEPCRFFRNKHMFVPEQAPQALQAQEEPCAEVNCWCNRTMTCMGGDDELVSLHSCANPNRACYEV